MATNKTKAAAGTLDAAIDGFDAATAPASTSTALATLPPELPPVPELPARREAPPVPDLNAIALPATGSLAEILEDQLAFDDALLDDPAGEFASGELGKTQAESRAEIPSLAALHHRRRIIARALARLQALFDGQAPLAEAKRKQHRNAIQTLIAAEQGISGDKVESKLERLANADPRHLAFCQQLEDLSVQYVLGKVALMEVNDEIRDREQMLRLATAEVMANLRQVREGQ